MLERRVRIINHLGLHSRAAAKLVNLAATFESRATLTYGSATAEAGSILDVLMLSAAFGDYIEILVEGPDEEDAMAEIERLFRGGFGEL
jgi:phosphotransferase system HPr (HPr) family protein